MGFVKEITDRPATGSVGDHIAVQNNFYSRVETRVAFVPGRRWRMGLIVGVDVSFRRVNHTVFGLATMGMMFCNAQKD